MIFTLSIAKVISSTYLKTLNHNCSTNSVLRYEDSIKRTYKKS